MGRAKRHASPHGADEVTRRRIEPERPLQPALDHRALGLTETALTILLAMCVPTAFFAILALMHSSVAFRDIKTLMLWSSLLEFKQSQQPRRTLVLHPAPLILTCAPYGMTCAGQEDF